jgi:hypothetical protein
MFAVPAQAIAWQPREQEALSVVEAKPTASPVIVAGLADSGWFE